jgi:putative FmdB family regulatory protein
MPTYQYKCADCEYEFEEFQRISDEPLKTCPNCGGKPERVVTGGIGFVLKGSGFYSTDYRSQSYNEGLKNEESSTKADLPSKSTKTDKSKSSEKKSKKG